MSRPTAVTDQEMWTEVDRYLTDRLISSDEALEKALEGNAAAGLPSIDVTALQGRFLQLIARMSGAKRILEVGTLGGYSTIWLARALPRDGVLVTLEVNAKHAEVALANVARAGVSRLVDLRQGPALESLTKLHAEGAAPFDLIFIDADKPNNPNYLEWAIRLARPGTVLLIDNVIREGGIIDESSADAAIQGTRRMFDLLHGHSRLDATALQTVGSKTHDGFVLALVKD